MNDNPWKNAEARNLLRRDAHLPLIDVATEEARDQVERGRREYRSMLAEHATLLDDIRHEVVAEFAARNGRRPQTSVGWWGVNHLAQRRFEAEVEQRFGITRP